MLGRTLSRTLGRSAVVAVTRRGVKTEAKLAEMGITLPSLVPPKGNYVLCSRAGNMLFTAGHLPQLADGTLLKGKVGMDFTPEQANDAARVCAINLISTIKQEIGDLDKVRRITKLVGFVNSTPDFTAQPSVINGASDLLGEVFGERGVHARSAVSAPSLPLGIPVEIELIVEIED